MTEQLLRRPVATWVLFAATIVLGVYAMPKLRVESMPEVELPTLTVRTTWSGASPSAVHRSITVPMEEVARRVHGIEEVVARSYPGFSQVEISFRRDVNIEFARLELAEQIGAIRRDLPMNARPPEIRGDVPEEFQTADFFTVSLISPLDPNDLREKAEQWIVPQVMGVEGVASAEIRGGANRILHIVLDREKLRLHRLSADAVLRRVLALDDITAGGVVRTGPTEALVSIRDKSTVPNLEKLVVGRRGERLIRLRELGEVRWDHEDPTYLVRINGQNMVLLSAEKRRGSNAVSVSRRIRAMLPELEASLPFEVIFEIDEDQGGELEKKLRELIYRSLLILGVLLLLLLLSMRSLRLAATVVASILLAVLISLSLFYFLGISVNFITISGLTVCFGMILDNSILVLDSVHRRISLSVGGFKKGWKQRLTSLQARQGLVAGAGEVAFPILATTFTTMVAFLSFVFLSGRLSLYYAPLAVAVATAMGASILVALGWMPVALRSVWMGRLKGEGTEDAVMAAAPSSISADTQRNAFEKLIGWTLRLWWLVILLSFTFLAGGWFIYKEKLDKGGFWRVPERETLVMFISLPEGTDILETYGTMRRFEDELLPVPEGVHLKTQVWRNNGRLRCRFEDDMLFSEYPLLYRNSLIDLAEKMAGMGIFIRGFDDLEDAG
jgi:HAE1 family hydrophobic/amphiphilic exporter-1